MNIRPFVLSAAIFAGSFTAALTPSFAPAAEPAPGVHARRLPEGIHPQAAVDALGMIHLIYCKGEARAGDIYYIHSTDQGRSFSPPVRVNSQPASDIVMGTIRGPQLAAGKDHRVHVVWMGSDAAQPKSPAGKAPLLYSRSRDDGAFEPQRNLIGEHPGLDGGGSVAADGRGNVFVAWHASDAEPGEGNRRVWVRRSADDGATFDAETAAFKEPTGVCGCCGIKIAADQGHVFLVYRTATGGVHRDSRLLVSDDGAKTFRLVSADPWTMGMCVMSTAALAPRPEGLLAAWETQNQIRLLDLHRLTQNTLPISLADQGPACKHPALAVDGQGNYVVAWIEGSGWNKGGTGRWQLFTAAGKPVEGGAGQMPRLPAWDVPAVVSTPHGFEVFF